MLGNVLNGTPQHIVFTVDSNSEMLRGNKVTVIRALRGIGGPMTGLKEAKDMTELSGTHKLPVSGDLSQDEFVGYLRLLEQYGVKVHQSETYLATERQEEARKKFTKAAERELQAIAQRAVEARDYDLVRRLADILDSRRW